MSHHQLKPSFVMFYANSVTVVQSITSFRMRTKLQRRLSQTVLCKSSVALSTCIRQGFATETLRLRIFCTRKLMRSMCLNFAISGHRLGITQLIINKHPSKRLVTLLMRLKLSALTCIELPRCLTAGWASMLTAINATCGCSPACSMFFAQAANTHFNLSPTQRS